MTDYWDPYKYIYDLVLRSNIKVIEDIRNEQNTKEENQAAVDQVAEQVRQGDRKDGMESMEG